MATSGGRSTGWSPTGGPSTSCIPGWASTCPDPETWAPATATLRGAVDVAAALGATGLLTPGGAARGIGWEAARSRFAEIIGPVAELARDQGVRILLEPVRTQFAFAGFVHSLRDGVELAASLDLGLVVDVTHCWWEPGLLALLDAVVDRVGAVHLADLQLDRPVVTRVVPGDGDLALEPFVAALVGAGYRGPFEIEVIGPAVEQEGAARALARSVAHVRALVAQAAR